MSLTQDFQRSKHKPLIIFFIAFTLLYLWLVFAVPADTALLNKYGISSSKIQALRLTTAIPYILIWFTALYGYIKFRNYSQSIKESREGKALTLISGGLLALAVMLPFNTVLGNAASYFYHRDPDLKPALVIITNYITVIFLLYAFTVIARGAGKLQETLSYGGYSLRQKLGILALVIFGLLYIYLTFTNPGRRDSSLTPFKGYYLPDWLLVLTIVLPYLYIWYSGAASALRISLYSLRVTGTLYRKALSYLAKGLAMVIVGQMAIRYLISLSPIFDKAELQLLLLAVYVVLLIIGVGFGLIAYGARKLQKIEDV